MQDGFVWPLFILNEAVLAQAGLSLPPNNTFELFHQNLGCWMTVKIGHITDLKGSSQVFIKSVDIHHHQDLSKFLVDLAATSPNIRKNLAGEWVYVRQKMIAHEISQCPAPSPRTNTEMTALPSPPANNLACFLLIHYLICHLYHCLYFCSHFYCQSQHTHPMQLLAQNRWYAVMVQHWKSTLIHIPSPWPPHHLKLYLVFAGSVLWTEKIHRTELNRTVVRSIFRLQLPKFWVILVAGCLISKIIQNCSKTG